MWGWKKEHMQKMFFQENWQTKEIPHRFCNKTCPLECFFSTDIIQVQEEKLFFLDLSSYRWTSFYSVCCIIFPSNTYSQVFGADTLFSLTCNVALFILHAYFFPPWVVAVIGSIHVSALFSTEAWVLELLPIGACPY